MYCKQETSLPIQFTEANCLVCHCGTTISDLFLLQIIIWSAVKNSRADHNNTTLALIVLVQFIPRLYLIFPLSYQIVKADGVVTKTAWAGAAYNLLLYMIASHVSNKYFLLFSQ